MEFPGAIRMARVHSNGDEGDYVTIEIRDTVSGVQIFSGKMTLEDYAIASFGMDRPILSELRGANLVGANREFKTVFVPGECSYATKEDDAKKACAPFEIDGWSAAYSDFGNHHKGQIKAGAKGYNVSFRRFVKDGVPVSA